MLLVLVQKPPPEQFSQRPGYLLVINLEHEHHNNHQQPAPAPHLIGPYPYALPLYSLVRSPLYVYIPDNPDHQRVMRLSLPTDARTIRRCSNSLSFPPVLRLMNDDSQPDRVHNTLSGIIIIPSIPHRARTAYLGHNTAPTKQSRTTPAPVQISTRISSPDDRGT